MRSVIALYKKRDFKVEWDLTDGQFEPWRQELNTDVIELNIVSKDEHVDDSNIILVLCPIMQSYNVSSQYLG